MYRRIFTQNLRHFNEYELQKKTQPLQVVSHETSTYFQYSKRYLSQTY
jgi:hypothetical protein